MKLCLIFSLILLGLNPAWANHSPIYSYEELSKIVGYRDIWEAHQQGRLSLDEHWALSSYVEYDDPIYPEINIYLRSGKSDQLYYFESVDELKKTVVNMDSGLEKLAKLPGNLITFRGTTFEFRENRCYDQNEEYRDLGFVSTSVVKSVAEGFAGVHSEKKKGSGVLYLYSNTEQHPGLLINPLEKEVLLPRGMTYKVMKRKDLGGVCHMMVQICEKICQTTISRAEISDYWEKMMP
jgi:hypothetical protein